MNILQKIIFLTLCFPFFTSLPVKYHDWDRFEELPLHRAVIKNDLEQVKVLLKKGMDVNQQEPQEEQTPLLLLTLQILEKNYLSMGLSQIAKINVGCLHYIGLVYTT